MVGQALPQAVIDITRLHCYANTEGPLFMRGEALPLCPPFIRAQRGSQLRPHPWKCLLSYTYMLLVLDFHKCVIFGIVLLFLVAIGVMLLRCLKGHSKQIQSNV